MESEDTYAAAALRVLDDEPRTPSRVDLVRAIAEGRRRRRVRRLLPVGAVAAATVAVAASVPFVVNSAAPRERGPDVVASAGATGSATPSAPVTPEVAPNAPKTCYVNRLPVPGGHPMSLVTGADPTGRFIVGRAYPEGHAGEYPLLIWENGKARTVTMPGADQAFNDITSTGIAVGAGWGTGPTPYVYRDGAMTKLRGVRSGSARAINESGVIVGSRDDSGNPMPVRWRSATATAEALPLPGKNWWGEAIAVADDGTILGLVHDVAKDQDRAYVWAADGTARLLPPPPGSSTFRPFDMNREWVTGMSDVGGPKSGQIPVIYNLRTGTFTPVRNATGIPQAVNAIGWAVGSTTNGRAFLLTNRGQITLPDFDNHRSPVANMATTISDDGRTIAGQGDDAKGVIQPVVWRCR